MGHDGIDFSIHQGGQTRGFTSRELKFPFWEEEVIHLTWCSQVPGHGWGLSGAGYQHFWDDWVTEGSWAGSSPEVCLLSRVRDTGYVFSQGQQQLDKIISLSDLGFLFCKMRGTPNSPTAPAEREGESGPSGCEDSMC